METTAPELLKMWNYKKNTNLHPSMFTKSSNKSVWWRCTKCGNEWKTQINYVNSGRRCSKCAKRGINSKPVRCIETNIVYPSMTEAAKQINANRNSITCCCKGTQKTAGGYHWEYV